VKLCKILSYSFVWNNILSKWCIWHSKDEIQCPHCLKYNQILNKPEETRTMKEKNTLVTLEAHKKKAKDQVYAYLKQKRELVNALVLIIQDFSQIPIQKGAYEDLIFTIYYIGENRALNHSFYHFIAKSPNNNLFVIQTYKQVIGLKELQNVKKIIIWSDGCRQHFKNSSMMIFWCVFHRLTQIHVVLEFFESHHGNNACDCAASHVKRKLNQYQRDNHSILENAHEIAEICSTVKNHKAFEGPTVPKQKSQVKTLEGITQYYKFIPNGVTNSISAYSSSDDETIAKTYTPSNNELLIVAKIVGERWNLTRITETTDLINP